MLKKFGRGKNEMEEHKEKIELEQGGKWLYETKMRDSNENLNFLCM